MSTIWACQLCSGEKSLGLYNCTKQARSRALLLNKSLSCKSSPKKFALHAHCFESPCDFTTPSSTLSRHSSFSDFTLDFAGAQSFSPGDEADEVDEEVLEEKGLPLVPTTVSVLRRMSLSVKPLLFHKDLPVFAVSGETLEIEQVMFCSTPRPTWNDPLDYTLMGVILETHI